MQTSTYNFVRNHTVGPRTITMYLEKGQVTFTLQTLGTVHLPEGAKPYGRDHLPSKEFSDLVGTIRVTVTSKETDSRATAEFSGEELVAILGDRWPDDDNIDHLRRSVTDRKCYPLKDSLPPPERSFTAQGQTKKPGAHSEQKHR